jgi:hypothetical protein
MHNADRPDIELGLGLFKSLSEERFPRKYRPVGRSSKLFTTITMIRGWTGYTGGPGETGTSQKNLILWFFPQREGPAARGVDRAG